MTSKIALSAGAFALVLAAVSDASAAGLYFSERGVRPLGRGGAFVAGADDFGAVWYNPAGLADAGTTLFADFSWIHFTSDFTRRSQIADSNGALHETSYAKVSGSSPFLPIPTLGGSYAFGSEKQFTFAGGIYSPYSAISTYPLTVNGEPAGSRYSLISLDGSVLVTGGLWFAYKASDAFRIGGGVQMLTGTFKSSVVFSASPADRIVGAPEDTQYDALSGLKVGPIFAPSANLGITVKPTKNVRIGLSGQLPFRINAPAKVTVSLPNAVEFDGAYQQGEDAKVTFNLPAILRLGIEARPIDPLRIELAYVREFWSTHRSIDVNPENIKMYGIKGFPSPFGVSPISIPRNFRDTSSVRVGGEYALPIGEEDSLDLRAGINWEQSAVPNAYLSVLTLDLNKVTASLGAGYHIGKHWRLDAVYAHIFASDATVSPAEALSPRVNPVKGNPTQTESVNGGSYSARADVIGLGVEYKF
jgi:long-chain fatty acid transport protein